MSRNAFPAKYDGRCGECGEVIVRGELLTYDDNDRVVHPDCTDSVANARPGKPPVVCTVCFITKAENGACSCD